METKLKIATLPKSGTCLLQNIVNWLKHNRQDRRLHAIEPAVDAFTAGSYDRFELKRVVPVRAK
jgi:hypothetical protein